MKKKNLRSTRRTPISASLRKVKSKSTHQDSVMSSPPQDDVQPPDIKCPKSWQGILDLYENRIGDKIVLMPSAVRGIKKSKFENAELAAKCLIWLAFPYRNHRLRTQDEPDIKEDVDSSLNDGPAGKADFSAFEWDDARRCDARQIRRSTSREPRYCLRIYYYWSAATKKVVIVSMPHHAKTRAT